MRIAYISYEHPLGISGGGIGTYMGQITELMSSRGHEVELFTCSYTKSETFQYNGYILHRIQALNLKEFRHVVLRAFKKQNQINPFDIIESAEYGADALDIKMHFPLLPLTVKLHTPSFLISRLNQYHLSVVSKLRYILGGIKRGKLVKPFWLYNKNLDPEYELINLADSISSPSNSLKKIIQKEWQFTGIIKVLPNPFTPSTTFLNLTIPKIIDGKIIIGFIGRLEKRKGVINLMNAIPSVLSYSDKIIFRFIGQPLLSPDKELNMEEYIKKYLHKYINNLQFYNAQPYEKMPDLMSDCHICIFPSLWENFPNVCLEAMSAGKAVIGTNNGGMAEIITNEESGVLIKPRSPSEISSKIIDLVSNPNKIEKLGKAARQKILDEYNGQKMGVITEAFYSETIAKVQSRNLIRRSSIL